MKQSLQTINTGPSGKSRINGQLVFITITGCLLSLSFASAQSPAPASTPGAVILTPPAPHTPQIHGPKIFGVRPAAPFLYAIPATGDRPMQFAVAHLPMGLQVDSATGQITGVIPTPGAYDLTLQAKNALGSTQKNFRIVAGNTIALTPPMGWNSWNCFHADFDQQKILETAQAMVKSGLSQHGWVYINIDDTWQGLRGGPFNAIQPDPKKIPDIKALSDQIHALGLKFGIYSTPWITSYARHAGGTSQNPQGTWDASTMTKGTRNKKSFPYMIGPYHFYTNDAKQWAAWNVDYLKFDWAPVELPETQEMDQALRASGRDIVYSLSNNATESLFNDGIAAISKIANSWRIGHDISDNWKSLKSHAFGNDQWAQYAGPGHWNDPDMFEVGANGGGAPKKLTPDEQYLHVSAWCLECAPLLLGCDLNHLDPFTIGLLTNDEVLDIDQDTLGKQGMAVSTQPADNSGDLEVYAKPLADGTWAVGLFNLSAAPAEVTAKWSDLKGVTGPQKVRDLWRQKDIGQFSDSFNAKVPSHGVVLIKVSPAT